MFLETMSFKVAFGVRPIVSVDADSRSLDDEDAKPPDAALISDAR